MDGIARLRSRLTDFAQIGADRRVFRTNHGILKQCDSAMSAAREAQALQFAATLLSVRVPRLLDRLDAWILVEDVGSRFPTEADHLRSCAAYLACIHQTDLGPAEATLLSRGHHHYWRDSLTNRLRQECDFAARHHFDAADVASFRRAIDRIIAAELPALTDVLGHGDPKRENFVVNDGDQVFAIDWHDFGLSNRWYELAHLLWSVAPVHRAALLAEYRTACGWPDAFDATEPLRYGAAVNALICAGTLARKPDPSFADRHALRQFIAESTNDVPD